VDKSVWLCVDVLNTDTVDSGGGLLIGPADVDANVGDTVMLECAAKKYNADTGTSDITWSREGQ